MIVREMLFVNDCYSLLERWGAPNLWNFNKNKFLKISKSGTQDPQNIFYYRKKYFGGVAQLGEHLPCKQGVRSSNLLISTKKPEN